MPQLRGSAKRLTNRRWVFLYSAELTPNTGTKPWTFQTHARCDCRGRFQTCPLTDTPTLAFGCKFTDKFKQPRNVLRTTKTVVVVRVRRFVVVAVRAAQVVSIVVPTTTPQNAPERASYLVSAPKRCIGTPTPFHCSEGGFCHHFCYQRGQKPTSEPSRAGCLARL